MTHSELAPDPASALDRRTEELFREHRTSILVRTDRMFAVLMVIQWLAGIVAAFTVSPRTWAGLESRIHPHVWAAVLVGGFLMAGPVALALIRPGRTVTRHAIAVGQMLTSALLIHLSGGRIETHFHVFGSLAFIAFYRDWPVLVTATVVVAADHLIRGFAWPESVYGIVTASNWRWLEHAGWVVFEDVVLFRACWRGIHEMRLIARRRAELEATNAVIEERVHRRTAELAESEERFRMVVRAAKEVIFDAHVAGGRTWWSDELSQLFGLTQAQIDADPEAWIKRVHPEDRGRMADAFRSMAAGALDEWSGEYRVARGDGSVVFVSAHCVLLRDSEEKPLRVIGAVTDITLRKIAEQGLQMQYAVARLLAQAETSGAVWEQLLPLLANSLGWKFAEVLIEDRSAGELVCRGTAFTDPACAGFERATRARRFAKGIGLPGRVWESPRPHWVTDVTKDENFPRASAAAEAGLHGALAFPILVGEEFFGVIGLYHEAVLPEDPHLLETVASIGTQLGQYLLRKKAEERAREQEDLTRQAHKMESVGRLAAGIAHEINTPIQYVGDNIRFLEDAFRSLDRVMIGYASFRKGLNGSVRPELQSRMDEVLREADVDYLEGEVPKAIRQSLEGVDRVSRLVRAMKEFSHPGSHEMTPTDLNQAIETTATVARNEWKYVAEFVTEFDQELPPVLCLPGDINQVILNLIVNAAHAIGDVVKNGAKGKITIRTRKDGEWAEIRITDTGTGIPEHVRPKLFEPFFTTKGVGKGTGQGLALSRAVVVGKHHGTLTFETEVGRGTTFVIRLPLSTQSVESGK